MPTPSHWRDRRHRVPDERVEAGSQQIGEAGRTMEDIVSQVRGVSDLIVEISVATNEQSGGIGQVGLAVTQLDQVTQQNAALVEASAAAAESLRRGLASAGGSHRGGRPGACTTKVR